VDEFFNALTRRAGHTLKTLSLNGEGKDIQTFADGLSHCTNLHSLHLYDIYFDEEHIFFPPTVQSLRLVTVSGLNPDRLLQLLKDSSWQPHLRRLSFVPVS